MIATLGQLNELQYPFDITVVVAILGINDVTIPLIHGMATPTRNTNDRLCKL